MVHWHHFLHTHNVPFSCESMWETKKLNFFCVWGPCCFDYACDVVSHVGLGMFVMDNVSLTSFSPYTQCTILVWEYVRDKKTEFLMCVGTMCHNCVWMYKWYMPLKGVNVSLLVCYWHCLSSQQNCLFCSTHLSFIDVIICSNSQQNCLIFVYPSKWINKWHFFLVQQVALSITTSYISFNNIIVN